MKRILGPRGRVRSHAAKGFLTLLIAALANGSMSPPTMAAETRPALSPRASVTGLPLDFERNLGQAPREVQFLAHGPAYAIAITEEGAALTFGRDTRTQHSPQRLRLRVHEANRASVPMAEDPLPVRVNYFIGNDPSDWRTGIATYD